MNDDADLLHRFAEESSQSAFSALVSRHIDLVYATAMRRTSGDPRMSADIAQDVFASLARQARKLARHPALAAWLHTATRNAALKRMISEQRRRVRETEAVALTTSRRRPTSRRRHVLPTSRRRHQRAEDVMS